MMSNKNQAILELYDISQEICVKHKETKKRNKQLGILLKDIMVPALKKDPLFNALFTEIYYTGSYFEGLKIDKPDEFDLNFKLRLPVDADVLKFRYERNVGGQLKILNLHKLLRDSKSETDKILVSWCGKNGEFDSQQLLEWFKNIVEVFLVPELERNRSYLLRNNLHYDKMNFGGFAYTFMSKEFDIDLVPAIEFQVPYTPDVFAPQNVRKLPKPSLPWLITAGYKSSNWRMCMKEYEKRLLRSNVRVHVKPAIRLIKKLKETHSGWQKLNSYPIYNAAFWACKPRRPRIPRSNDFSLEETFFAILTELHVGLLKNRTLSYWTCVNDDGVLHSLRDKESRREMAQEIGDVINELRSAVQREDAQALRDLFEEKVLCMKGFGRMGRSIQTLYYW